MTKQDYIQVKLLKKHQTEEGVVIKECMTDQTLQADQE
jgi:hypothetical protein